jgi:hypothetical protein
MTTSIGGRTKMDNPNSKQDPDYEVVYDEQGRAAIKVKREKPKVEEQPKVEEEKPKKKGKKSKK